MGEDLSQVYAITQYCETRSSGGTPLACNNIYLFNT